LSPQDGDTLTLSQGERKLCLRHSVATLSIRPELSPPMPDIACPRPDQAVVSVLLQHMRRPSDDSRTGNHIRKHIQRKTQVVQHRRRKIIHIGDDPLGLAHALLRRRGNTEPAVVATHYPEPFGHGAQLRGTWITGTVYAMAKAWQLAPLCQRLIDECGGALGR